MVVFKVIKCRLSCGEILPRYVGTVRLAPRLCVLYPGICLTNEEKAGINLSQGTVG